MKIFKKSVICVLSLMSLNSFAGTEISGGGNAVVCLRENGVEKAYLLDLFEAEKAFNYTIERSDVYWKEQVSNKLDFLRYYFSKINLLGSERKDFKNYLFSKTVSKFGNSLEMNLKEADEILKFTEQELPQLNDYKVQIIPKGCAIKRLAVFQDGNSIIINKGIWNLLSETDKAALFFHENLYKVDVILNNSTSSNNTRRNVGFLFSNSIPEEFLPLDYYTPKFYCNAASENYSQDKKFFSFIVEVKDNETAVVHLLETSWMMVFGDTSMELELKTYEGANESLNIYNGMIQDSAFVGNLLSLYNVNLMMLKLSSKSYEQQSLIIDRTKYRVNCYKN